MEIKFQQATTRFQQEFQQGCDEMDSEKVFKAWECCNPFNRKCNECPYEKDCYHDGISRHMVADAVALLKEYKRQDGCPCTHCMEWECDEVCEEYKKWRDT